MSLWGDVLDVVFPERCLGCDRVLPQPRAFFCDDCAPQVEEIPTPACLGCHEPGVHEGGRCERCRRRPPRFTFAFAPLEHSGAVARAIQRFKYEGHPELARPLGTLLVLRAKAFLAQAPEWVVPLPLHAARYRERGYDQTALLAVEVARAGKRQLRDEALTRVRATSRQVGQSDEERAANVAGAFEASPTVKGARLLLVDDVLTTGATANEAARALLEAGALEVQVLTLARAVRETRAG
ncbi:MAG: phosphoribosyltransferase [Myxococcaceae bacterium]|nr:phosphoribosyltransferase [Myxococcaceae bacterium]